MNNNSKNIENKIDLNFFLKVMEQETEKLGIDFLVDYGIRICLSNGTTLNLTTNAQWNEFVRDTKNHIYVRDHYSYYLKYVTNNKFRYQIRRPEDADTEFLKHLARAGMCNSLTIFTKTNGMIVVYFFVANPENKAATSLFYNNLHLFDKIVNLLSNRFFSKSKLSTNTQNQSQIISQSDIYSLFNKKDITKPKNERIFFEGKELLFTQQEIFILKNIDYGFTLKLLAKQVNLTVSGVNFHIINIKKKIAAKNKQEVIKFAYSVKGLI